MNNSNPKTTIIFPGFKKHHKNRKRLHFKKFLLLTNTSALYILHKKAYYFIMYCVENNGETLIP